LLAGRLNSPFAKTLLARRGVDFATGLLWLCDRWKSGAFTGGAIDFCPCLFWFRPFHEISFAEMMKTISGCLQRPPQLKVAPDQFIGDGASIIPVFIPAGASACTDFSGLIAGHCRNSNR
jgi:hypothetical protein